MLNHPLDVEWLKESVQLAETVEKHAHLAVSLRRNLESAAHKCRAALIQDPYYDLAQKTLDKITSQLHNAANALEIFSSAENPGELQRRNELRVSIAGSMGVHPDEFFPITEQERDFQGEIDYFENTFLTYGSEKFLPLTEKMPEQTESQSQLKLALQSPFRIVRQNKVNPLRNFEVLKRIAQRLQTPTIAASLAIANRHFYSYGSASDTPNGEQISGGFSPLNRMMSFHDSMDFSNEFDLTTFLHECIHVMQAAHQMKNLEWYFKFYCHTKHRLIVDDECQAYGLQIEGINLITNNRMRQGFLEGNPISTKELMDFLHAHPSQEPGVDMLRRLAEVYYPQGSAAEGIYSREYRDAQIRFHLAMGCEVYEHQNGQLKRMVIAAS